MVVCSSEPVEGAKHSTRSWTQTGALVEQWPGTARLNQLRKTAVKLTESRRTSRREKRPGIHGKRRGKCEVRETEGCARGEGRPSSPAESLVAQDACEAERV